MTRIEKIKTATIMLLALANVGQAIATLHRSVLIDSANERAEKWKAMCDDAISVAKNLASQLEKSQKNTRDAIDAFNTALDKAELEGK